VKAWLHSNEWPLGLFAAAVVVRLAYLASVVHDPFFMYLRHIPDAFYFNNWAQEIVSNHAWLGGPGVFFIGPLYAYFLAAIYALVGPDLFVVRIIHIVLDAATTVFLYGFTRRAFDEKTARLAGVLWAVYLPAVFFTSFILPVSLDLMLVAGALYFLARGERRPGWCAAAGAMWGLAALDRSNLLLVVLAVGVVFVVGCRRWGWLRPLYFVLPVVAVVGATTVRNRVVAGDWVVVSSQGGVNFFIGNSELATGVYWNLGEFGQGRPEQLNRDLSVMVAEASLGRKVKPSEASAWWMRRGMAWLWEHPARAARLYWDKVRLTTNDYEVGLNVDFYFMKYVTPVHGLPIPWFGFIFAFGVVGAAWHLRRAPFARIAGLVFAAAYGFSVILFFISSRYRIPLALALTPFAAAGLTAVVKAWGAWRWRRAAAMTAAAVAAGFFAMFPPVGINRAETFGQSYYRYGRFYFDEGDYERAVENLTKTTKRSPEIYAAYFLLGVAYERLGQYDTAAQVYYDGTRAVPGMPAMHVAYGISLARLGRVWDALGPLRVAAALDPTYVPAWTALGEAYATLRDWPAAEDAYRRAAALAPADAEVKFRFAQVLFQEGKGAAAAAAAGAALALDPKLEGPNHLIGSFYYLEADYASAAPYFEREAELNPAQPGTFALLAATYMAMGDRDRAVPYYRTYLRNGGEPDAEFEIQAGLRTR
jgi:tetratricopeptide (TPR) repeat protein